MNLIKEDNEIHIINRPKPVGDKAIDGETILFTHKLPTQENYISVEYTLAGRANIYYRPTGAGERKPITTLDNVENVQGSVIGNTIVFSHSKGVLYVLWKDNTYLVLGDSIPTFKAAPYLDTKIEDSQSFYTKYGPNLPELSIANLSGDTLIPKAEAQKLFQGKTSSIPLYGEMRQNVYNRLFATLNLFRNELKKFGSLTEPFFIRFAYRMYDGEHTMQTSPILLIPNSDGQPIATVKIDESGNVTSFPFFAASRIHVNYLLPEGIDLWKDIITHIDIFISSPITNYTDSPEALESLDLIDAYDDSDGSVVYKDDLSPFTMTTKSVAGNKVKGVIENLYNFHREQNSEYDVTPLNITSKSMYLNVMPFKEYRSQYLIVDTSLNPDLKIFFTKSGVEYKPSQSIPFEPPYPVYKAWYLPKLEAGQRFVTFSEVPLRAFYYRGPTNYSVENPKFRFNLKRIDGRSYEELFENVSAYYKICEMEIGKIAGGQNPFLVEIKENVLNSLEAYEKLSDLAQSRSKYIPSSTFVYNSRENFVIDQEYPPICTTMGEQTGLGELERPDDGSLAFVEINENSQTVYKEIKGVNILFYFSYPSINAVFLHIYFYNSVEENYKHYKIPLKKSPFINSAYAFTNLTRITDNYLGNTVKNLPDISFMPIKYGNKIVTSETNNPFLFSETNTSILKVSKILALSTSTKALSEGQFGMFPLCAFTDEGIWALSVHTNPLSDSSPDFHPAFDSVQPISRDVCINTKSITQIDNAILFSTDRGIMMLQGSSSICISDLLIGEDFDCSVLPGIDKLFALAGYMKVKIEEFLDFVRDMQIVYDYRHQRLTFFNSERPFDRYAYVYSMKDKCWGMAQNNIAYTIKSYPEALAVDTNGNIVDFTQDGELTKGVLITRSMSLGYPDILKTINSVIIRGVFANKNVGVALYGTRDNIHWGLVSTSVDHILRGFSGTPYKYFRLCLLCNIGNEEAISGVTIDLKTKETNHSR